MIPLSRRQFLVSSAAGALSASMSVAAEACYADGELSTDLISCGAAELACMIRRRQVSCQEVVRACIERIKKVNLAINAVVCDAFSAAEQQAEAADQAIRRGTVNWSHQPLWGVPVTIKDAFDIAGMPTACGVPSLREKIVRTDATAVRRLKDAGAIILGKTNVPALCMHFETDNACFGATKNPYDLARSPGGSSGGEAAIIAACGAPLGLGTDGGGSIRLPAHCCGVAGIRPGWGRVSMAGTFPPPPRAYGNYYTAGPLARHVADLALALQVLSGPDPRDPYTFPAPLLNYRDVSVCDLRIALWTENPRCTTTAETRETVEQAAAALEESRAIVVRRCPPHWEKTGDILQAVYDGEVTTFETVLQQFGIDEPTSLDKQAVEYARQHWQKMPAGEVKRAIDEWLPMFQIAMLEMFEEYDALLLPVSAGPAVRLNDSWNRIFDFDFTLATSLVPKVPGGSVRCGWSAEHLPIGVQVVTKPYREDIALAIMRHFECKFGGWQAPPEKNLSAN